MSLRLCTLNNPLSEGQVLFKQTKNPRDKKNYLKDSKMTKVEKFSSGFDKKLAINLVALFMGLMFSINGVQAQNQLICGEDRIIDTYVIGLFNSSCFKVPNVGNVVEVTAEVWIDRSKCSPFPNSVTINGVNVPFLSLIHI